MLLRLYDREETCTSSVFYPVMSFTTLQSTRMFSPVPVSDRKESELKDAPARCAAADAVQVVQRQFNILHSVFLRKSNYYH